MVIDRRWWILLGAVVVVLVVVGFAALSSPNQASVADDSELAAHKAAVQRMVEEGFNQGNIDIPGEIYAEDYVGHLPPSEASFREQLRVSDYRELIRLLRAALPDLRMTTEILVAEGDYVAERTTVRGTFEGELYDTPPTDGPVEMVFNVIHRFNSAGKIVEEWIEYDTLSFKVQLGVLQAPVTGD